MNNIQELTRIIEQNAKPKTVKLLKEKGKRKKNWPWVRQRLLTDGTKRIIQKREKNWTSSKLRTCTVQMTLSRERKDRPQAVRKNLQIKIMCDKRLEFTIYKEPTNFKSKKIYSLIVK